MVIRYGKLSDLVASMMYKDIMTVKRKGEAQRNPDGSMSSKLLDSFLQNEPCLVRKTTNDSSRDDNLDVARKEIVVRVYCHTKHQILKGDILELSVLDDEGLLMEKIEGHAGQPAWYPDHLEIEIYDWKVSQ